MLVCWIMLAPFFLPSASEGQKIISLVSLTLGETAVLSCQAPGNKIVNAVEWTKSGLEPEYVFLYQDGHPDPDNQHPSFQERVELQDRRMTDGDASLILKNVTTADSGTYECWIEIKTHRRKRANLDGDVISVITLSVAPPGQPGADSARRLPADHLVSPVAAVGFVAVVVVVAGVVAFAIYKRVSFQSGLRPNCCSGVRWIT